MLQNPGTLNASHKAVLRQRKPTVLLITILAISRLLQGEPVHVRSWTFYNTRKRASSALNVLGQILLRFVNSLPLIGILRSGFHEIVFLKAMITAHPLRVACASPLVKAAVRNQM